MEKEYDKNRLVSNIEFLLKRSDIKIGDLETQCGVSVGYLSRLKNNESNDVSPSAEVLLRLSRLLNVSLTSLLCSDMASMTETELFLQKVLEDMIKKTESNKLVWNRYTSYNIYEEKLRDGYTSLPLIEGYEDNFGGEHTFYRSMFTEETMVLGGNYYVLFDNNNLYYLIPVSNEDRGLVYELYILLPDDSFKTVCCSNNDSNPLIIKLLCDLFTSVEKSSKQIRIDEDVKKSLEDFLSNKSS